MLNNELHRVSKSITNQTRSLIIIHFLFFYIEQNLTGNFFKDSGKTWLSALFLGVITFHLSCFLKN